MKKPFTCKILISHLLGDQCNKSYYHKCSLQRHLLQHQRTKPTLNLKFASESLKKEERSFKCMKCEKEFRSSAECTEHQEQNH
jgi:hypothetical protein